MIQPDSVTTYSDLLDKVAALQQAMGIKSGPPFPYDLPRFGTAELYPGMGASTPRSPGAYGVMEMSGEAAEAKLVDYRGEKVAGFEVDAETLICLPQAFDLFLKNLVGGLHTVYTKLKRLEISPRVCNVEQVRALRSLGAIQPGVNRCKLIACKDFDVLYEDCTSASARPGRPPKRSPIPFGASVSSLNVIKKAKPDPGFDKPPGQWGAGHGGPLFPFVPLTPQQMMLSQFFGGNALLAKQMHAQQSNQFSGGAEPSVDPKPEQLSDDATHSDHLSSPNGAVNLSKTCDDGDSPSGAKPFQPTENSTENHTNGLNEDYYSDGESSPVDREQTAEMKTNFAMKEFPYPAQPETDYNSSVETLLTHVRGLIDVVSMTARTQMEQVQKDKWELTKLLDQERSEKRQLQDQLKTALSQKALYRRRWKYARRRRAPCAQSAIVEQDTATRPQLEEEPRDQPFNPDPSHIDVCKMSLTATEAINN